MAQVERMVSPETIKSHRWDARLGRGNNVGRRLLAFLEQLSARNDTIHFLCPDELTTDQLQDLLLGINERRPRLRMSLCSTIDGSFAPSAITADPNLAIVQIQWHVRGALPDLGFFKAFSRAGIWNHLLLNDVNASLENCRKIASHPNIIHSWRKPCSGDRAYKANETYGQVRPLPGRPLWQTVSHPVSRFVMVDRWTKDLVRRLRVDSDGDSLFSVGASLAYHFLPPDRLPDGCLEEICAMVAAGGTVATTHVRFNLQRAHLIGYAEEKGVIVANSSLKNPRPEYIEAVHGQSGLDLTGFVERGYTSVRPEYRGLGIGTKLLEGLTQRAGDRKIFSVIAEDNSATKIIAMRNRTCKVATYYSEKAGKPVGIWMPAWLIDTHGRRMS